MAKFVGFVGTISGKVGTTVFAKGEKGISYGRSYQPVVANPKTVGQVDQRAKMNLVGRVSQITPAEVLLGLGNRKRTRRSEFNKILLKAATIDRSDPSGIIAKLQPSDVVFSKGAQAPDANVTTAASTTATVATIGLTLQDSTLAGTYGERIVVAVIDPSDKGGFSLVKFADVLFDNTNAKSVNINYGSAIENGSMVCFYRIPYILTDEGAAMRSETLANGGGDIIAKILLTDSLVRDWGQSVLAATQVFTNA